MTTSCTDTDRAEANGVSAGARWTSGLGAFLLVAAAATFVAVRWDQISDETKLAALVALTTACLAAQRWLAGRLPITATALLHLGVLLVPIDVAAIGVGLGWEWPIMLLAQGLAVTGACGTGSLVRRSVVFLTGTWLGVVLLSAATATQAGAPAGLLLALTAVATVIVVSWLDDEPRRLGHRAALGWATLAGLATPLASAERLGIPAAGVLSDLGIASPEPHSAAMLTGLASAVALAIVATRVRSLPIAALAAASLVTGGLTTWAGLSPAPETSLAALAAVLLMVDATAWLLRRDPFWATPTRLAASTGAGIAAIMTLGFGLVVLVTPLPTATLPGAGLAAALIAVLWISFTARTHRRENPRGLWPWTLRPAGISGLGPLAAALAASAAVALTTEAQPARALTLTMAGSLLAALPPTAAPGAAANRVLATGLLAWAPVVGHDHPTLAGLLGVGGALVLGIVTVDTARFSGTHGFNQLVWSLGALSLAPLAAGGLVLADQGHVLTALGGTIVGAWLLAALFDRVDITPAPASERTTAAAMVAAQLGRPLHLRLQGVPLAIVPRLAALGPLAVVPLTMGSELSTGEALGVAVLFGALALADALRLREPMLLVGLGCALPIAVTGTVLMAGGTLGVAGVMVALSALGWLGLGTVVPRRWTPPAVVSCAIAGTAGLLLSSAESWTYNTNLMLLGSALLLAGMGTSHDGLSAAGGAIATLGLWQQLAEMEVAVGEPYVAPVAGLLLLAGIQTRRSARRPVSSWLTYAPAVGLVCGTGVVERLDGGPGWHAVLAGIIGVAAVVAGATQRLAGPLFVGTATVVTLTIHETLGATAQVPTWIWLAIGGALLLALGLVMERRNTGPIETGRRLVDLVSERFT